MFSMRRRILWLTNASLLLVLMIAVVISYQQASHEVDEVMDAELAFQARLNAWLLADNKTQVGDSSTGENAFALSRIKGTADIHQWPRAAMPYGHKYERYMAMQLIDSKGHILLESDTAPDQKMANCSPGFSDVVHDGRAWRVFVLIHGEQCIQVGEHTEMRQEVVGEILLSLLQPFVIAIPLLMLFSYFILKTGFMPVESLRKRVLHIDSRDPLPLEKSTRTVELKPVEDALNESLLRISQVLEREKRFSADAAHELRSLLSVLQIHVENAANGNDAERKHALSQLGRGIQRARETVTQLLQLARMEHSQGELCSKPVSVAQSLLAELQLIADEKSQTLALEAAQPDIVIPVLRREFEIILTNLVMNSVRHAPEQSEIQVWLFLKNHHAVIRVTDDGPGIRQFHSKKQRFSTTRLDQGGFGLGLSIVQQLLERHDGEINSSPATDQQRAFVEVALPLHSS